MEIGQLASDGIAVLRARWYFRRATQVGHKVRVWGRPAVTNDGTMIIHDRVRIVATLARSEMIAGHLGTLEIGESTFINYGCSIAATLLIRIGPRCNIGTHVMMIDNDFHRIEPERRHESPASAPIILEENVWLGGRVIVLKGTRIGAGSVIAAGSVVNRDIPPRALAAGMPARVIKML